MNTTEPNNTDLEIFKNFLDELDSKRHENETTESYNPFENEESRTNLQATRCVYAALQDAITYINQDSNIKVPFEKFVIIKAASYAPLLSKVIPQSLVCPPGLTSKKTISPVEVTHEEVELYKSLLSTFHYLLTKPEFIKNYYSERSIEDSSTFEIQHIDKGYKTSDYLVVSNVMVELDNIMIVILICKYYGINISLEALEYFRDIKHYFEFDDLLESASLIPNELISNMIKAKDRLYREAIDPNNISLSPHDLMGADIDRSLPAAMLILDAFRMGVEHYLNSAKNSNY